MIQRVGIISKRSSSDSLEIARQVEVWLKERGLYAQLVVNDNDAVLDEAAKTELPSMDLIVVVGGDGTMIRVARALISTGVPLVGINTGRVGFLFELSRENWREGLSKGLASGKANMVASDSCLALHVEQWRSKDLVSAMNAVNDIVVARGSVARLLALDLSVDGVSCLYLRADGLIISTPTGSTAYASSAGGPLLHPSINAFGVTAICPFLTHMTPLVLNAGSVFSATLRESTTRTYITVDGQETVRLRPGDTLRVTGVPGGVHFARLGMISYFSKLRTSGIMLDSPGRSADIVDREKD